MALAARPIVCQLNSNKTLAQRDELVGGPVPSLPVQKVRLTDTVSLTTDSRKIMLQPRVCTLRSYGSDSFGVMKMKNMDGEGGDGNDVSRFFDMLSEYIESSKKSQDFEIISGRLAMIVFASTVTMEVITGNSLFRKMDLLGIEEGAGACLFAVACAASFAWFSSARNRVDGIFSVRCNTFIDSLIDQVVDGMFYEIDPSDWSDDL
ncbi:stress enhanced protein 2 [Artemisia annua]|uniref:Stress enhanced protein 2 n=1 Tax=Artemisia annua TaxID=35608 RepID=A0A2U1KL27_ARTAN|nr:stress enhanced protein 2 [Artemisia annua]